MFLPRVNDAKAIAPEAPITVGELKSAEAEEIISKLMLVPPAKAVVTAKFM
jgi:hypothetical protein